MNPTSSRATATQTTFVFLIDIVTTICQLLDLRFAQNESLPSAYPECPAANNTPCASLITNVRDRAEHDFRYAIDTTKIRTELGYEPATGFDSGIAKTVDWYLDHGPWWQSVLDGSYRDVAD